MFLFKANFSTKAINMLTRQILQVHTNRSYLLGNLLYFEGTGLVSVGHSTTSKVRSHNAAHTTGRSQLFAKKRLTPLSCPQQHPIVSKLPMGADGFMR